MPDATVGEEQVAAFTNDDAADVAVDDLKKSGGDSKADLSFYECPTAAASIQFGVDADGNGSMQRYMSCSVDSDQSDNNLVSLERDGSISTQFNGTLGLQVNPQPVSGGYFGGYEGTIFQAQGHETQRPQFFIRESNVVCGGAAADNGVVGVVSGESGGVLDNSTTSAVGGPTTSGVVAQGLWGSGAEPLSTFQVSNDTLEGSYPFNNTTAIMATQEFVQVPTTPPVQQPPVAYSPQNFTATSSFLGNEQAAQPLERVTTETSFVQEGYEVVKVPVYRPVEIVEKTVEVPVVHHVDTFVPKTEIHEIESIVKKPYTKVVDTFVETPELHYTDKIVEVPEYHEVTKTVPKVEIQQRTRYIPKIEVKVVPKYVEVPILKYIDKYEEHEEIVEVVRHVEKKEVVEVPREVVRHVVKPVKKIIEQERIVPIVEHRDVPVEKIKLVPKIETVELVRQVPNIIDVPVPYNVPKIEYVDEPYLVPKYQDVPVAVPVLQRVKPVYHYKGDPQYIDVPVHRPYFVIHDHLNFKPAAEPTSESTRVVGMRQVDLGSLNAQEYQHARERLNNFYRENPQPQYCEAQTQAQTQGQTQAQPQVEVEVNATPTSNVNANANSPSVGHRHYNDVYPPSRPQTPTPRLLQ